MSYDGELISSDMPVDPKIEVHQRIKNTLLWNILKNVYTKATDEDIVNARYNHPDSISDTIDELERLR